MTMMSWLFDWKAVCEKGDVGMIETGKGSNFGGEAAGDELLVGWRDRAEEL